jgi:hypothetical protein
MTQYVQNLEIKILQVSLEVRWIAGETWIFLNEQYDAWYFEKALLLILILFQSSYV